MTERENWLRTVEYRRPEWIPCTVSLARLVWHVHREAVEELVLRHPRLFKGYLRGDVDFDEFPVVYREGEDFRDNWGCLWYNTIGGLEGQVVEHPLADWSALKRYQPPDPRTHAEREERDWESIKAEIAERRRQGLLVWGNGERLFDRLYFLRGFEALMMDIATDDPHLPLLIEMLLEYETKLVRIWLELGVDVVGFHTDIGAQNALMISPEKFRKYIKPLYRELFAMCRNAGAHVYLSSDGNLLAIVDDLIECGVSVHDPQYRANTLAGIERVYRGRLCVNVDLDRQMFAFCAPVDIREQVREVVARIGDPTGGLMVAGSVWDGVTSLENTEALCGALEDYCLM